MNATLWIPVIAAILVIFAVWKYVLRQHYRQTDSPVAKANSLFVLFAFFLPVLYYAGIMKAETVDTRVVMGSLYVLLILVYLLLLWYFYRLEK